MIYRVGDTIYIHLATDVLQMTADILEASTDWPRDGGRLHVEMRNWIGELYSEIQHRKVEEKAALDKARPLAQFESPDPNGDLR